MNDWAALFRSLTADNVDNVDNVEPSGTSTTDKTADNVDNVDSVEAPSALPADNVNIVNNVRASEREEREDPADNVNIVNNVSVSEEKEEEATTSPLAAAFAALERRCPDHIEAADWQHAVEDGRRFLIQWGEQATALGWAEADVFGLPPVPQNPHPRWQRLARVDQLGLVWLTHGRPVTAITAERATISTPSGGSASFYRLHAHQGAQKTSDTGVTVANDDPTRASNATRPSYEVIGGAAIGQRCALCNNSIGTRLRIKYGGQEHVVHPHHADEYVKGLAHPPLAAQPEGVSRSP